MKREETALSLLLNYNCKYDHFELGNYNLVLSVHLFRDFERYKNLSYPLLIKGNLKEKGTKYILRRPDLGVIMLYEILEIRITDYIQDLNLEYIKQFLKLLIIFI